MKLNELKNSQNKEKIRCQLLITQEITSNGNNYLKLEFRDRTKIVINIFNNNPNYSIYYNLGLNKLLFVEVEMTFKGINAQGYDEYDIFSINPLQQPSLIDCVDIERLKSELRTIIMDIKDDNLRNLLFEMCAYKNKQLLTKLFEAPVTEKSAYSFKGGTLAHIVRTCKLCDALGSVYNSWDFNLNNTNETVNVDLLKTIAIFHDLGKAEKYYFDNNQIKKTFQGELLEDAQISLNLFRDIYANTQVTLLDEQKILLEHAIAAAKGSREIGAICDPRTKEAEIFAAIERIDGTMGNFEFLQRINMGDDFQRLLNKQYFTADFSDI